METRFAVFCGLVSRVLCVNVRCNGIADDLRELEPQLLNAFLCGYPEVRRRVVPDSPPEFQRKVVFLIRDSDARGAMVSDAIHKLNRWIDDLLRRCAEVVGRKVSGATNLRDHFTVEMKDLPSSRAEGEEDWRREFRDRAAAISFEAGDEQVPLCDQPAHWAELWRDVSRTSCGPSIAEPETITYEDMAARAESIRRVQVTFTSAQQSAAALAGPWAREVV